MKEIGTLDARHITARAHRQEGLSENLQWHGKTATALGLVGDVDKKDMYAMANGIDPHALSDRDYKTYQKLDAIATTLSKNFGEIKKMPASEQGEALKTYYDDIKRHNAERQDLNKSLGAGKISKDIKSADTGILKHAQAGFDLTFAAPDSLAVVALVAGDERLLSAHKEAVNEVMKHVENNFSVLQKTGLNTENIASIKSDRYLSGVADGKVPAPTVSTRHTVFNTTLDNMWNPNDLSHNEMLANNKFFQQIYMGELANKVEKLGYATQWDKQENGNYKFEIKGVDKNLIDHLKANPANTITDAVNQPKIHLNTESVRRIWEETAKKDFGLIPETILNSTKNQISDKAVAPTATEAILQSVAHLDASKSVYSNHDVMHEAFKLNLGKSTIVDVGNGYFGTEVQNATRFLRIA